MKSKVLIIGGGHPQFSLIESFFNMGFEVIVIDDRKNSPAYRLNIEVIPINRYDEKNILLYAIENPPEYVSSSGNDKAVHIMTIIAKKLNIPSYISEDIAKMPLNKNTFRELLANEGLPTPQTLSISGNIENFDFDKIIFPAVIKPDEGVGQTGVNKVRNIKEAIESIKYALEVSKNKTALIQEYISGNEVGVNGFVFNGDFKLLTTSFRRSSRSRGGAFGVATEKVYPAIKNRELLKEIEKIFDIACKKMNIKYSPIYAQIIIKDNKIKIIEMMPRLGGGEDPRLVKYATGVDISMLTALISTGKKVSYDKNNKKPHETSVVIKFLTGIVGTVKKVKIENHENNNIKKIDIFFDVGDSIGELKTSRERIGYVLTTGSSIEDATQNSKKAEKLINIKLG